MGKAEENKMWNEDNELPNEEEKKEEENEKATQDLTNKKAKATEEQESQMKAAEENKQLPQEGENKEKPEGEPEEVENEEDKKYEEMKKEDDFHLEKNEEMEGLHSEKEEKEENELSLSMESHEEEKSQGEEIEGEGEENQNMDQEEENVNEIAKEEEIATKGKEEGKEEEPLPDEEKPIGPSSSIPQENQDSKPFGEQEQSAGAGNSGSNEEMLCSKLDITETIKDEFNKREAKRNQQNIDEGKLGTRKKEIKQMATLVKEDNKKAEDRKVEDNDTVVAKDQKEEEKKEDNAQAVGTTTMEIGDENIGEIEKELEDDADEEKDQDKPMEDIVPEHLSKTGKADEIKKKPKDMQKPKQTEAVKELLENEIPIPEDSDKIMENPELKPIPIKDTSKNKDEQQKETSISKYLSAEQYEEQKSQALLSYYEWLALPEKSLEANKMLQQFENLTRGLSATLCEQLRILLEPTQRTKLKGDYKTGKRLNMKKIIPFLASNYRNDKIWMRRCVPNKRDYKVKIIKKLIDIPPHR